MTNTPLSDISDIYLTAVSERDLALRDKHRVFEAMVALKVWTDFELPAGPQSHRLRLALLNAQTLIDEMTGDKT